MKRKDYLAKRGELVKEAETFLNEGNLEEFAAKEKEVNDLDSEYEKISLAQANMNTLKARSVDGVIRDLQDENKVSVDATKNEKEAYLEAWAKVMMGQRLNHVEQSVFDETNSKFYNSVETTEEHSVVIPESVTTEIWKEAEELFPIIADVRMTHVPGALTILQEKDSGENAKWYDEDTEVEDGSFTLGELSLSGCELAKNVPISWKLRKMSIERFIPYITSLLAEKMGAALAKGFVSGKGKPGQGDDFKPEPLGVITAIDNEEDTPQVVEYDNILGYNEMAMALGRIKSKYKSGSSIYATSSTIWEKLSLIKDEMGRPLFIPDVTAGGIGRMFGLVVKEDDSITDGEVLIGNMSRGYTANVNEDMTIYTEDHKKKRYTDYMAYTIVDGAPLTTKAFALVRPAEDEEEEV